MENWYQLESPQGVVSPSLLVYPDRIKYNIFEMIRIAGDADRLRPHVKTHKCREIVALQMAQGINKFKCATIAEAEMLAQCQAGDVLLAYQPTGPNISRMIELMQHYPETTFSALTDNLEAMRYLEQQVSEAGELLGLFIDLDVGMHRTGILPGPEALDLKNHIVRSANLEFRGWHLYDGHIRHSDFELRKSEAQRALQPALALFSDDLAEEIVAGGSPTFPVHALNSRYNLSPGTCLLWDQGYKNMLPDQQFKVAAVLITRVISKPGPDLICLDLGHKALASEMPHPRVYLPALESVDFVSHSEEHLVARSPKAVDFKVGDVLYGIPMHICPTVALHQEMIVIENGVAVDRWEVYARNRKISV
jgi:D-serine deaminase-like pyridoxal phosphate-dependent protein